MKSSPNTEEIPECTKVEVEMATKGMKRHKAHGTDGTTSDIKLGGVGVGGWGGDKVSSST